MLGDNVGIGVWKIGAKIQNNKQPRSMGFFLIGLDFSVLKEYDVYVLF